MHQSVELESRSGIGDAVEKLTRGRMHEMRTLRFRVEPSTPLHHVHQQLMKRLGDRLNHADWLSFDWSNQAAISARRNQTQKVLRTPSTRKSVSEDLST